MSEVRKPKRKKLFECESIYGEAYNQAIDDYEKYHNYKMGRLPDEGEIYKIILEREEREDCDSHEPLLKKTAKIIAKRIRE